MPWEVTVLCGNGDCFNQWSDRDAANKRIAYEGACQQGWEMIQPDQIICPWCVKRRAQDEEGAAHNREEVAKEMRKIAQREIRQAFLRISAKCQPGNAMQMLVHELISGEADIPF